MSFLKRTVANTRVTSSSVTTQVFAQLERRRGILNLMSISLVLFLTVSAHGQVLISSTNPLTQNFNSMNGGPNLPQGWRIAYANASPTWLTSSNTVSNVVSSGSPTANGSYAWATTSRTDWSIGVLSPKATRSSVIMLAQNVSTQPFNAWTVSYSAEEFYRNDSDSFVNFYYSLDGTSWSAVNNGKLTMGGSPFVSPVGYLFDTPVTTAKSAFSFSTPEVDVTASIYFRWEFYIAGPQSQGWGLDDITITPSFVPVPEPASMTLLGIALVISLGFAGRSFFSSSRKSTTA